MRRALATKPRTRAAAIPRTIPAPVEGWDAVSPLAAMDPKRAVILENIFPEPGYCRLRRGHASHGTGVGVGAVESLMTWEGPSSREMFAAGGSAIYDVTAAGAASSVVTGLTSARFQHTMMRTSGGNYLWVCNGLDDPRHYDGSSWATPTITGVTPEDIVNVTVHKRRLWFVLKNSTVGAYLDVDSIAGAATTFDFGPQFRRGGHLLAIGTWTRDGGDGEDDLFVAISSRGEIVIYQGNDPDEATDWHMVGRFQVGAPLGLRCLENVGADLAVITVDGVLPLSRALSLDRAASDAIAITARISNAINEAARLYRANNGWQLLGYPLGTAAILNIPVIDGLVYEQYVMNTLTGAWCRYTGQNAACWALFGDDLYFGGIDGTVYKADTGADDAGEPINFDLQTAWNYFGSRGRLKQFSMLAPLIGTDGEINAAIDLLADYDDRLPTSTPTYASASGSSWDEEGWDVGEWASESTVQKGWGSGTGIGTCASVRMRGASQGASLVINAFDVLMEPGGLI